MRKRIVISILLLGVVLFHVVTRSVSLLSLTSYFVSIIIAWIALVPKKTPYTLDDRQKDRPNLVFLVCITVGTLLYFASLSTHYHQDEFITAYTSWSLGPLRMIDWFGVYPPVWVSQFPILFHILQKPWLLLLGPTVQAVRISTLPYSIGIVIVLYALSRMFGSRMFALVTGLFFIFFAPHMYLESMGLHFVSSSFFYLSCIVLWLRWMQTRNERYALLSALFAAFSYLTYTSSYAVLPVLAIVIAGELCLIGRNKFSAQTILKFFFLWMIVMAPFIVYALTVHNFFLERIDQVNSLWGTWSEPVKMHTPLSIIISQQIITAIRALVVSGIGGHGGYNFGGLALLDPLTAFLFFIGVCISVWKTVFQKNITHFALLVTFFIPFVSGFILTTHPPPFHRISLIYPLIALFAAQGFWIIRFKKIVGAVIILYLIVMNWNRTMLMIRNDIVLYPQNSRVIGSYVVNNITSGSTVFIAAYPSFYLQQELLFRTKNRYILLTDTTETILKMYDGSGLLILFSPSEEVMSQLKLRFSDGQFLDTLDGTHLGDLMIFLPHNKNVLSMES